MAEAKKRAEKEEKKKTTSKKTATTPKNTNKTKKVAVSSKKDTAKVAPKKEETNKNKTTSKKNNKTSKTASKKTTTKVKENKKEGVLKALDEEILNKTTGPKTVRTIEKKTEEIEEKRSVLEELVGTPKTKEEKVLEDNGIFSSKVIWYLFFILVLIILAFLYVYNEDTNKTKKENSSLVVASNSENSITNNRNEVQTPSISEEEAKEVVKSFFGIKSSIDSDPTRYLRSCGLTKEDSKNFKKSKDGKSYITDVVFDDLERRFENIISRDCFETTFANSYKQKSGVTHSRIEINPVNRFEINEMVRGEGAKPTYKVKYTVTPEKGEKVINTRLFEFELNKGRWIISNTTIIQ